MYAPVGSIGIFLLKMKLNRQQRPGLLMDAVLLAGADGWSIDFRHKRQWAYVNHRYHAGQPAELCRV